MQVTLQKLSPVLVQLDVQVDADRVKTEITKAYNSLAKTARVRGFRPGKAPRKVLAHMFGPRVAADVAQRLVDETFPKAVSDKKVQPVTQPSIEPERLVDNQPFSYTARVEVIPEIESVEYAGLEVEKPNVDVTEDDITAELDELRRANSTLEPLKEERPAQKDDVVTLDFVVSVDGDVVPDAGAEGFQAELGSGMLLSSIEEAIVGKQSGESGEVAIDMPETHPHPALKGKSASFRLTVKDIKERVLPDADDEFAKDLGEYDTLEDLKKELGEQVRKRRQEQADNAVAEALVRALVQKNPIEIPPSLVQRQMQSTEQELLAQARRRGQPAGGLPPELRAQVQADSELKVRAGLLMAEIAKKEDIKIGDAEIEEGLKELSDQTGKNIAKLRAEYRPAEKREQLVGMILENKVLDIIESKAKITEASGPSSESDATPPGKAEG